MQHMIATVVFLRAFDRHLVRWFFDDTNRFLAPFGITANRTQLSFRETEALLTVGGFRFDRPDRFGIDFLHTLDRLQDEERQAGRSFLPNAGKFS